ncbi:hypothetical protein HUJ04_003610 [Dendroctonus ponderosae]|nr:hypothetical protein HUJ04_003610 [Dendroctonus ponderosae]
MFSFITEDDEIVKTEITYEFDFDQDCVELLPEEACSECNMVFYARPDLISHIESEHQNQDTFSFIIENDGLEETEITYVVDPYHDYLELLPEEACPECNMVFYARSDMLTHIENEHRKQNDNYHFDPFDAWTESQECPLCNRVFPSNVALLKHKIVCDPTCLYKICKVCNKFIKKTKLDRHIAWHKVKRKTQLYSCEKCDKTFRSLQYLKLHREKVHENKGIQYPCDVCGKRFSTKYRAEYHKKTIHLKDFNVHCEQCGRGFLYLTELTTHVRRVHDKEVNIFYCTVANCRRGFRSNAALKYHLQTEHSDNKPQHICAQCNKTFHHISLYKRHLSRHTDIKRFSCDTCGNQYTSKHTLEIHLRTHTGERPFVCEHCGNSFTARKFLKVHLVVHTKEKPYACLQCSKTFTQKGSLNIHVKKDHTTLPIK